MREAEKNRGPHGATRESTKSALEIQGERNSALIAAIRVGEPAEVERRLREGASPDARDISGDTALIAAAKALGFSGQGRLKTLQALLSAGANPNKKNPRGECVLNFAASAVSIEGVKELLGAGADPRAACSRGWSPIHRAAERGAARVIDALLKAGSPVDEPNDVGETPLMIAAFYDEETAVARLLAAGADPDKKDSEGMSALGMCRARNGSGPRSEGVLIAAMEASALRGETRRGPATGGAKPEGSAGPRL